MVIESIVGIALVGLFLHCMGSREGCPARSYTTKSSNSPRPEPMNPGVYKNPVTTKPNPFKQEMKCMGNLKTKEETKSLVCSAIDGCDTIAFEVLVPNNGNPTRNYTKIIVVPKY